MRCVGLVAEGRGKDERVGMLFVELRREFVACRHVLQIALPPTQRRLLIIIHWLFHVSKTVVGSILSKVPCIGYGSSVTGMTKNAGVLSHGPNFGHVLRRHKQSDEFQQRSNPEGLALKVAVTTGSSKDGSRE